MEKPLTQNIRPDREPLDIAEYEQAGGYQALRKALQMSPAQIQQMVTDANLRGRGGAGFPAGQEMELHVPMGDKAHRPQVPVRQRRRDGAGHVQGPAAHGGRPEPGGRKRDRRRLCHRGGRGLHLPSLGVQAGGREADQSHRPGLRTEGTSAGTSSALRTASTCICTPAPAGTCAARRTVCSTRSKASGPSREPGRLMRSPVGLWGMPTVVNNVETLANVPYIVSHGAGVVQEPQPHRGGGHQALRSQRAESGDRASGNCRWGRPWARSSTSYAGGMIDGYQIPGLLPGGASTSFLLEEHFDAKMDFASVQKAGSRLGTGTIIVLDDKTCPVGMARQPAAVLARESCGWCTPCREGLPWVQKHAGGDGAGRGRPG